ESGGGLGFYPTFCGSEVVKRILRTGDPQEAIDWLSKVLNTTEATGKSITALWGVAIDRRFALTSEMEIVQIDDLPESQQKSWIAALPLLGASSPIMSSLSFTKPTSALVVKRTIRPFVYDPKVDPTAADGEFTAIWERFNETARCLTLLGPRVSLIAAHWFTFDDPDLEEANVLGAGRSQPFIEILPIAHQEYPMLNATEAPKLVQSYLALNPTIRNRVSVALDRLSQAQRRHDAGDQAVELMIALESLLGDKAKTEMMHKVRVRAARLMGGSADTRTRNSSVINRVYDIRSKLVHNGERTRGDAMVTLQGQRLTAAQLLKEATETCMGVIKSIILRGSIPNWPDFDIAEHVD
ncbi:MAG: hypothetical protein DMF60_14915, partial [Acidobacteria bacterium]